MSMTDTVETELLPLNEIRRTDDDEALRNDPHLIYLGHSWNFEEMLFYACLCFIVQIMGFTLFRTYLATHFTAYNVVLNEHCSAALSALCPSSNVACAGASSLCFLEAQLIQVIGRPSSSIGSGSTLLMRNLLFRNVIMFGFLAPRTTFVKLWDFDILSYYSRFNSSRRAMDTN